MYCVREVKTDKDKKLFLSLPKKLYSKNEIVQDYALEIKILNRTHCLSFDFDIVPLICVDESEKIKARCIITFYPNDELAYFGFFECYNDVEVSYCLFMEVEKYVKARGLNSILGPLDCSFWIKYRLKINNFITPYTCEPYNKNYYEKLILHSGYLVSEKYISNEYGVVDKEYSNLRYEKRLENMRAKGYIFRTISKHTFNSDLIQIYYLLTHLYSSFPGYKDITLKQFISLFSPLNKVIDYNMVELVFEGDKLIAFLINLPDYGNTLYRQFSLSMLLELGWKKKNIGSYILLYMGVDEKHLGLARALAEITKCKLAEKGCTSVGALIHEGTVTGKFFNDLMTDVKYEYALYQKNII